MDKFISTSLGGIPEELNDIRWRMGQEDNHAVYQALNNLLGSYGSNFIVQGCIADITVPTVATMTEGWIMINGELLKVDANTGFDSTAIQYFTKVTTNNPAGLKTLQSGVTANTYQINRGVITASSGNLRYDGARLSRIKANTTTIITPTVTTSGVTLFSLTPSVTMGSAKMNFRCWIAANSPGSGSAIGVALRLRIGGVTKETVTWSMEQNSLGETHSFEWEEEYVAGQEVQIISNTDAATMVVIGGGLFVESHNGE